MCQGWHIVLCGLEKWRKQKGIDSGVRRKFKGVTLMPNIGYGCHLLPTAFKKFVAHNAKE
ncbi:putative ribosomal protein L32e [Helianthus annuus]|uniref:Ribosomal protein L32e n=1 Tax=Helianthus annuus TaxID=4232 RepID=A0A9K3JVF9_HELAN|nr:putative ribosomal protein L32e [Helianthus annuus]KAJ0621923.1 putative ribosomal protein L32e [Helianthus annuus]KAJ0626289.1 putative ribosomal protein L32e [Helianthus annuus]KAJ0782626.1 putative ribosomal protein L32e [Helianthus annuus]